MIIRLLVTLTGRIWRLKERCNSTRFGPLQKFYLLLYRIYQFNHGASISYNSRFRGVPCLPHGMHGIFISGDAIIGRDCVIFQQVTIGSNALLDSKGIGAPTIGNNCYIGAGATIIGNVTVGDNVRVGANCVVYRDVPDNSVVVSGTQTIVEREAPLDNRFYSYQGRGKWRFFRDGHWMDETDPDMNRRLTQIRKK